MENYEKFLYESPWIEAWRSRDLVNQFKSMLLGEGDHGGRGVEQFEQFVFYVKRFVVWCQYEPQFDMIFAVAPTVREKIESCISHSLENDKYKDWLKIEEQILRFYRGAGW